MSAQAVESVESQAATTTRSRAGRARFRHERRLGRAGCDALACPRSPLVPSPSLPVYLSTHAALCTIARSVCSQVPYASYSASRDGQRRLMRRSRVEAKLAATAGSPAAALPAAHAAQRGASVLSSICRRVSQSDIPGTFPWARRSLWAGCICMSAVVRMQFVWNACSCKPRLLK